jgi:signal transduction histidine kinase
MTIRRQLTIRLLLAFGVPLVLAGVAGYFIIRANLQARVDAALLAKAEAIVSVTTWDAGQLRVDAAAPFMREFDAAVALPEHERERDATAGTGAGAGPRVDASVFEIHRADGAVLARSASLGVGAGREPTAGLEPRVAIRGRGRPTFWNVTLPSGIPGRALAFAFVPHMPHEGTSPGPIDAVLIVAIARQDLDRTLRTIAGVLTGVGLLLAATIAIAVSTGLRYALRPLDTLADEASRIDADSLATRFPLAALPGELIPIADRLNDLLSRLEQSFDRERQFSANVAHELRTPLAELRTTAELSLKWPDTRKADVDRDILAIARHMEGMVTGLLALLRSERGQLPIAREPLALAPMVRSVWEAFAERAAARQLYVRWRMTDGDDDVTIHADAALLRSILTNVIENAVDYTPAGGAIRIELNRQASEASEASEAHEARERGRFCLRIANTIETLTQEDVSKLFDRFWRHDAARSETEHIGLGLPLARAFAIALHYDLTASIEPDERGPARLLVLTLSGPR